MSRPFTRCSANPDLAFEWLDMAYRGRNSRLPWVALDPRFDSLRADARFEDLLRRMNQGRTVHTKLDHHTGTSGMARRVVDGLFEGQKQIPSDVAPKPPMLPGIVRVEAELDAIQSSVHMMDRSSRVVIIEDLREVREGLTMLSSVSVFRRCQGHHYKTAAAAMGITTSTVSFHLKHIYENLQVHSKTEAVSRP